MRFSQFGVCANVRAERQLARLAHRDELDAHLWAGNFFSSAAEHFIGSQIELHILHAPLLHVTVTQIEAL